ncbi:hypothetical protein [Streptomyces sp. NPDC058374]|uniref:hypothetical protein n=1 Tax=Streptomyces sp. NPDC058374 TaxID=3346466 RepID=UPI003655E8E5
MRRETETRTREASHLDRFLISLGLIAASLLWLTADLEPWAKVLCVAGSAVGVAGAVHFGRRRLRGGAGRARP